MEIRARALFACVFLLVLYWLLHWKGGKAPPGPIGLPVLGYLPFMTSEPHLHFQELAEIYGPIFSIRLGHHHVVVLNDLPSIQKAAVDAQQSENAFSLLFQQETMGERKRKAEKPTANNECACDHVRPLVNSGETKNKASYSIQLMINTIYVHNTLRQSLERRPISHLLRKIFQKLNIGTEIEFASDVRQNYFIKSVTEQSQITWNPYRFSDPTEALKRLRRKEQLLQHLDIHDHKIMCEIRCVIVEWLMLVLAAFPEVQRKVRLEVSNINISDLSKMPYTKAVVSEVIRWRSVPPLQLLGLTDDDIMLDGYFIAKNTFLLANVWSVNHNPRYWGHDVDSYRPERFLHKNGRIKQKPCTLPFISSEYCQWLLEEIHMHFTTIVREFYDRLPLEKNSFLSKNLPKYFSSKKHP